jgi:hypothetical protein
MEVLRLKTREEENATLDRLLADATRSAIALNNAAISSDLGPNTSQVKSHQYSYKYQRVLQYPTCYSPRCLELFLAI